MFICVVALVILLLCRHAFSTAFVLVTCTQSHVVLNVPSSAELHPRISSWCQQPRKRTIYVENRAKCLNSSYPLLVDVYSEDKQPGVSDLVAINCCSNLESAINERIYPEHMDLLVSMNSHGDLDVEVVEKNVMIVDGHYAVPTLCQLIDEGGDELKISALTDEGGCVLSDAMSPFSRRLSNHGISYSAHLNSSAFAHMKRPRLQCSIVACGEQCLGNGLVCNPKKTSFARSLIITKAINRSSSSTPLSGKVSRPSESCSWIWRRSVLVAVNVLLFVLSSVVWFFVVRTFFLNKDEIIEMLKHTFYAERREPRPRLDIIHPIDSFSSPPSLTSEKVSTIRLKLNQISTLGRKSGKVLVESLRSNSPSTATDEHLSVQELHSSRRESGCFVSPSMMDSLPDPPQLCVEELPQLEKIRRLTDMNKLAVEHKKIASASSSSSEYCNLPVVCAPIPTPRLGAAALVESETPILNSARHDQNDPLEAQPFSIAVSPPVKTCCASSRPCAEHPPCLPIFVDDECEFNSDIVCTTSSEVIVSSSDFRSHFGVTRGDVEHEIAI